MHDYIGEAEAGLSTAIHALRAAMDDSDDTQEQAQLMVLIRTTTRLLTTIESL